MITYTHAHAHTHTDLQGYIETLLAPGAFLLPFLLLLLLEHQHGQTVCSGQTDFHLKHPQSVLMEILMSVGFLRVSTETQNNQSD